MKAVTPRQGRISYRVRHGTLIIDLKEMYRIISSAPRRGGIVRARSILNHQVPANPSGHRPGTTKWSDPARYLGRLAVRVRARMPVIGLMTAVPMTQLIVDREQAGAIWLECFCTVGVTNAVRAGDPLMVTGCDVNPPGTINIILVTNATLSMPALVGAVQVATESKTGILIEQRVRSTVRTSSLATGTGTDAVVIASSLKGIHRLPYSGTHTLLGAMIGRLVSRCVRKGLARSRRWSQPRSRTVHRARTSSR
jgi:iron complex transport system ATP-binding protein